MWMMPLHLHVNQKSDYDMIMMMNWEKFYIHQAALWQLLQPEDCFNDSKKVQALKKFYKINCLSK